MSAEKDKDVRDAKENEANDIASRFPDPDADTRLQTGRTALPDPPKQSWRPPISEAAGTKIDRPGAVADFRGIGTGYYIGIALVSSILIGTGIGWALDTFVFHTKGTPWGLILGFFAGTINGFVQMILIVNRLNAEEDAQRKSGRT